MPDFSDDDDRYLRWVSDNPTGFVLNVRRNPGANYTVLHRATCGSVTRPRDEGAYAPQPPVMFARAEMAADAAPTPVAAGQVELTASVSVQFELAP